MYILYILDWTYYATYCTLYIPEIRSQEQEPAEASRASPFSPSLVRKAPPKTRKANCPLPKRDDVQVV